MLRVCDNRALLPEPVTVMPEALLRLSQFDCHLLRPLELSLGEGECLCLSGPSGSGKSRLLRAIADLDPHGGEALLEGRPQSAVPAPQWRRQVALLPADSHWWSDYVHDHFKAPPAAADLQALGLTEAALEWSVSRLSSGERQRLALLRLITPEVRVLLLDEPTANLDADTAGCVERWLLQLMHSRRLGLLWVSHDPAQVARVADRRFVIRDERLQEVAR